ncbi:MAG: cytochrome c oxidase subunit 3 [Cohaesibacteraceae bacterium]|nr:cytochrome c oxidase subunit 3 [Cohaesibacteraceae bacterium]MBL4876165.1 cytochrome c oxidase subunit 3 [Cohaesibacteraceae bacterium]
MADAHANNHDYHLVDPSPWPFVAAVSAFIMAVGAIFYMRIDETFSVNFFGLEGELEGFALAFYLGFAGVLYTFFVWWAEIIKESKQGHHTRVVSLHLRYGMILFIASEVMFFVAWFWAFFDASLYADEAIQAARVEWSGGTWPPVNTIVIDPWHLPLLNTLLLLTSGTTVTWAHHALLHDDRKGVIWGLILTIVLAVVFTGVQAYEYVYSPFGFVDTLYGSTFFMATGFHGFHVIVGTIFLLVCLIRANNGSFTPKQHFGFEAAAWYWHFVDVVWLFLFAAIYVWGNSGGVVH